MYLTYGIGLFFLTIKGEHVKERNHLRQAWFTYVFSIFVFPLIAIVKTVALSLPREARNEANVVTELNLADLSASGISWTFVGISLLFFIAAILPRDEEPPTIKNKANSTIFGGE